MHVQHHACSLLSKGTAGRAQQAHALTPCNQSVLCQQHLYEQGSLLGLALHDDLEELLAVDVLLLHEDGSSLVQDLNVALNKVLCPSAGGQQCASAGWWQTGQDRKERQSCLNPCQ